MLQKSGRYKSRYVGIVEGFGVSPKLVPGCEKARYIPPLEWFDKLTTSGGKVPLILSQPALSEAEGKDMSRT